MIHELFIIIPMWIQPSWCPNICASMLNVSSHDWCCRDCSRPILLPVLARRVGLKDSSLCFPSSLTHNIILLCSRRGCPTACRRQLKSPLCTQTFLSSKAEDKHHLTTSADCALGCVLGLPRHCTTRMGTQRSSTLCAPQHAASQLQLVLHDTKSALARPEIGV